MPTIKFPGSSTNHSRKKNEQNYFAKGIIIPFRDNLLSFYGIKEHRYIKHLRLRLNFNLTSEQINYEDGQT